MMGLFRHTTGWLAFFLAINVSSVLAQTCRLPPHWSINGISPMGQARGSVMVVALLQASCPLCLWQATGLENIKQQLAKQNVNDIRFIIINSNLQHSIDNVGELARRVTFPVYQDTHSTNIWDLLNGGKDDVLIYDRCGLLTYHIPYPLSLLNERHFQNAFLNTYLKNPCGCNSSYNPEPVQRGLAPSQQSNRQTTQLVRQQPGGQRQRPADRSHSRQHQQQT